MGASPNFIVLSNLIIEPRRCLGKAIGDAALTFKLPGA
jgi:hypothetical protein